MSSLLDHPDSIRNDTDSKTLSRLVMVATKNSDFTILLHAIQTACKLISRSVRKAGIANLYGAAGSENATGDSQKKLDVLSNEMMVNALYNSNVCAVLVSEENEEPIIVEEGLAGRYASCPPSHPSRLSPPSLSRLRYCVAFDPLDGSSNIDCNVSTGTIFSVWEKKTTGPATVADILRPGCGLFPIRAFPQHCPSCTLFGPLVACRAPPHTSLTFPPPPHTHPLPPTTSGAR